MKRLTEGAHQTSDDLIVANAAYSWYASEVGMLLNKAPTLGMLHFVHNYI